MGCGSGGRILLRQGSDCWTVWNQAQQLTLLRRSGRASKHQLSQGNDKECSIRPGSQDFGCVWVCFITFRKRGSVTWLRQALETWSTDVALSLLQFWKSAAMVQASLGISNILRWGISKLPRGAKKVICEAIALIVYWPLAKFSLVVSKLGLNNSNLPLVDYAAKPFYQMRNDALDRFGTRIEQRFSKSYRGHAHAVWLRGHKIFGPTPLVLCRVKR